MKKSWFLELFIFVISLLLLSLLLSLLHIPMVVTIAGLLFIYLGWHFFHIYRLQLWLSQGTQTVLPKTFGIWQDIYDYLYHNQIKNRKRRRRLAVVLRRFRESSRALPDAIVVLNHHLEIIWFNHAANHLLGLQLRTDYGQRIDNLLRNPKVIEYLQRRDFNHYLEIPSPVDNDILLALKLLPYGMEKAGFVMIVRDVTQRYRIEQMRRDFVANVSHELRTPLTVLNGYLETLAETTSEDCRNLKGPLNLMHQQAQRMRSIVEDLLLLAKLESSELINEVEVNVPRLIYAIREDAYVLSGGKHNIELDIDADLFLLGSQEEIRAAFSNLVFNAIQYTPAEGNIFIEWYQEEDKACFKVSDDGPGIESHHIPRLTERFYRADVGRSRQRGGTGLGLSIVKHVLDRHQAHIKINSQVGQGSEFICYFSSDRIVYPQRN